MCHLFRSIASVGLVLFVSVSSYAQQAQHNIILFVADGLRPGVVNQTTAPAMTKLLTNGVRFSNSHSIFPSFTMANAASISTGHGIGDHGIFSNTIYTKKGIKSANDSVTPMIENDDILGELDSLFNGDYLNEETILAAARKQGFQTAAVGKLGPTLMFDHTARNGTESFIIDDSTGRGGIALSPDLKERLTALGLATIAPTRELNGQSGNNFTPGTTVANKVQQQYFIDVTTKAILPSFKQKNKPFVMVFWSRDPDGSQHFQGDSLNELSPGINGPTSMAAVKNADNNLAAIQQAVHDLGLEGTTDIILTSDHGFSTISKQSKTSHAAQMQYPNVVNGLLPPGFVGKDLANALSMNLYDPDNHNALVLPGSTSLKGNATLGANSNQAEVIVAANGGSDLLYVPSANTHLVSKIISILSSEDYTSGIFVNDRLGRFAGTLPMSSIGMIGSAVIPTPDIVVNFTSYSQGCQDPTACGVTVADHILQQGQGMHGSFSRADTMNIMGAIGPSFKYHYVDTLPTSNADIGITIAQLLKLPIKSNGNLKGRLLTEAMPGGQIPVSTTVELRSDVDSQGHVTVLKYQQLGEETYFDVAGYPEKTLGLGSQ